MLAAVITTEAMIGAVSILLLVLVLLVIVYYVQGGDRDRKQ